jgi:hypothetical protein
MDCDDTNAGDAGLPDCDADACDADCSASRNADDDEPPLWNDAAYEMHFCEPGLCAWPAVCVLLPFSLPFFCAPGSLPLATN